MMERKLTAVSLFSGCGGFDYGASQAGVEIIWANDIDPHAAAAYKSLFPHVDFMLGDVHEVDAFPEADVMIGCYPCTGFSLAARRRWRGQQERNLRANSANHLYLEFLEALAQIKPKYFFVENVRGMATASGGWFLEQQLEGFSRGGYRVVNGLLDAGAYGIAQSRKRVFIVGVREDIGLAYEFCRPTHGPEGRWPHKVLRDTIGGMEEWPHGEFFDYKFHGHYLTRNRKRGWDELSYTIVANAHHLPLHPMGRPMRYIGKDKWALQGDKNRRLSWRECAAIQGLPLHIAPSGSLMDKYRVVGNAVPPALGRVLLEPVVRFESGGAAAPGSRDRPKALQASLFGEANG